MPEPRFECDQCGACCRELIVQIDEIDLIREPRLIPASQPIKVPDGMTLLDADDNPVEEIIPGYGAGAMLACGSARPCPMIGPDNLCAIYPTRPNCCVGFVAGDEQCQDARAMAGLAPLEPLEAIAP